MNLASYLMAGIALVAGATPGGPSTTVPMPTRQGDIVIVDAGQRDRTLTGGGSATRFSVGLPDGATCPGDSQFDQWRAQSFMIPLGDDPGDLRYSLAGPDGPGQWGLYDLETHTYTNTFLRPNPGPGRPGVIEMIPPLSFAVFPPGILAPGRYTVGIACTYFNHNGPYWDTEMVISADPGDQPSGFRWTIPSASTSASTDVTPSGAGTWTPWLITGSVAAAGLVAAFAWRRPRRQPAHPQELIR